MMTRDMRLLPLIFLSLLGAPEPLAGQAGPSEFSLRDLVRAANGHLGVAARNLASGRRETHDGGRRFLLGRTRALVVAVAVLDHLRRRGGSPSETLPYPRRAYRGHGVLGRRHAERFRIDALIRHALRTGDPSALDLLHAMVGAEGVATCMKRLGITGFGRITSLAEERAFILGRVDERLSALPPEILARWFDDGETRALDPLVFDGDPRKAPGFASRLARARNDARAAGLNTATPAALVALIAAIWKGEAGHPHDCALLAEELRSARRLTFADRLPVCWQAAGLHESRPGVSISAGVIETGDGPVVLALCANGYSWREMVDGFFARMGRTITFRLAPKAADRIATEARLPRGVLAAGLLPRAAADDLEATCRVRPRAAADRLTGSSRELFRRGEDPTLVIVAGGESPRHVAVRWCLPGGRWITDRATLPAGGFHLRSFVLGRPPGISASGGKGDRISGEFRVRVAVDGELVLDAPFTVSTRAP